MRKYPDSMGRLRHRSTSGPYCCGADGEHHCDGDGEQQCSADSECHRNTDENRQ